MGNVQPAVLNVRIYDREYALRTSGDVERLRKLCSGLDKRMRQAASQSGSVDTLRVAILAAVSLMEELARAHEDLRKIDESVGRRSLECVSILDRFLS
jgi:cell division protein ZapA